MDQSLELQDASQHLSWKAASANEVTFACYLANKLDIRVEWELFHPDLIASYTAISIFKVRVLNASE